MKTSIRNKNFILGIVLFLTIIIILSIFSVFYLTKLSNKTSAILKENHYSVVYARDMAEHLTIINQKIANGFLLTKNIDTLIVNNEFTLFSNSLILEKNNITEIGEDSLVREIETSYNAYLNSVSTIIKLPNEAVKYQYLQKHFDTLYEQLMQLSLMNEKAIETKTDDARVYAKKYSIQMSFIGTFCFLIAFAFTFSFSSYFNDRFFNFYYGINEVVSSNYSKSLPLDGEDELTEISLIFNQMADEINENNKKTKLTLHTEKATNTNEINELKDILNRMKSIEKEAKIVLSKLEIRS